MAEGGCQFERGVLCPVNTRLSDQTSTLSLSMKDGTSINLVDVSPPFFADMTGWNEHELSEDFRDFALAHATKGTTEVSSVGSQVKAAPTNGSLFDQVSITEKSLVGQESPNAVPNPVLEFDSVVSTTSKNNGKESLLDISPVSTLEDIRLSSNTDFLKPSSALAAHQPNSLLADYLVPASVELPSRWQIESNDEMEESSLRQSVATGKALYNPFDDLSLSGGQDVADEFIDCDFKPADVNALFDDNGSDLGQKTLTEAFSSFSITSGKPSMEGISSASTETSKSAYFAARSSQLGTIEADSEMDEALRPKFGESQSIHSPMNQEPYALYDSSNESTTSELLDGESTQPTIINPASDNVSYPQVYEPSHTSDKTLANVESNNSLVTRDIEVGVSDNVSSHSAPSQFGNHSGLMTNSVNGLSVSYSEKPTELPDLTFKTIGSPKFNNPNPHLIDKFSNEGLDNGSPSVSATNWKGDTQNPQELGAALGALFESVICPPSAIVQLSTICEANGRYEGDISSDDSLNEDDQLVHKISHVVTSDSTNSDGLINNDSTHKSFVSELPTRLSVEKCGVPKAVSLDAGTDSALISASTNKMYFKEACCVGCFQSEQLSIYSHSDKWLQLQIDILNGKSSDHSVAFSVVSRITIGPQTKEDIKVLFAPFCKGSFHCVVRIVPSPLVPSSFSDFKATPLLVAVEADAELPNLQLENDSIDFGQVAYGCSKLLPVKLSNHGHSTVPLWLTITSHFTAWHCFSFVPSDGYFSQCNSTSRNRPTELGHSSIAPLVDGDQFPVVSHTIATCNVPPTLGKDAFILWIRFSAPLDSGIGSVNTFAGMVDMRLNTVKLGNSIAGLTLKADVGIAKLEIPLKAISLCCEIGKMMSRSLPVSNAGSMGAHITVEVSPPSSALLVHPSSLHIQPGETGLLDVVFSPTTKENTVERILQLNVDEARERYKILIRGTGRSDKKSFPLACNMPLVHFGGVDIGSTKQLDVLLQNLLETKPLDLDIEVAKHQANFQIQLKSGIFAGLVSSLRVTLQPKETTTIGMTFIPTQHRLTQSTFVVRTVPHQGLRYTVPMFGYGGVSQVVTANTKKARNGETIHMGEIKVGEQRVSVLKLHNIGCRSAYVKAVCLSDVHLVTVTPAEFILHPNDLKELLIICLMKEKNSCSGDSSKTTSLGLLHVYYVDEYSRVRFKRALEADSNFQPLNLPKGLGSIVDFPEDDTVVKEVIKPTKFLEAEEQVLLSQLRDLGVTLTGNTKTELSVLDDEMYTYKHYSKLPSQEVTECQELNDNPNWYITPKEIIVPAHSKSISPRVTKVHLFNKSDHRLRFSLFWPKHLLSVSPEKGVVEAKHHVTLLVSHRSASSKQQLPWLGSMTVYCDGIYQAVRVQIRKGLVADSPVLMTGMALKSVENQQFLHQGRLSTEIPEQDIEVGNKAASNAVRRHIQRVLVEDTEIMHEQDSQVQVNLEVVECVDWRLWSVVPVYVKIDGSDQLMRATYAVFHFKHTSGSCLGGEKLQLSVSFRPRDVGVYSQTWELEVCQFADGPY
jgi:centrosomal protein CEP192